MAAIHQPQHSEVGQRPGEAKKKEIYKYLAPWTVYGMNWSVRPDKRFRLAIGSFIEDYKNKVALSLCVCVCVCVCVCAEEVGSEQLGITCCC